MSGMDTRLQDGSMCEYGSGSFTIIHLYSLLEPLTKTVTSWGSIVFSSDNVLFKLVLETRFDKEWLVCSSMLSKLQQDVLVSSNTITTSNTSVSTSLLFLINNTISRRIFLKFPFGLGKSAKDLRKQHVAISTEKAGA